MKKDLRHSVLSSVLDVVERNAGIRERLAFFEIGPIFWLAKTPTVCPMN